MMIALKINHWRDAVDLGCALASDRMDESSLKEINRMAYSQAAENNKTPILQVIEQYFAEATSVLEIGCGTGQHALYFAQHLPHLVWQPSDHPQALAGMQLPRQSAPPANLSAPIELDVSGPWPSAQYDGIFSANTAHIMSWPMVCAMMRGLAARLRPAGYFCLYGPFNYAGNYTSQSNESFDSWLKSQDPLRAIRDQEAMVQLAAEHGLQLVADHAMPANNRVLVWRRGDG